MKRIVLLSALAISLNGASAQSSLSYIDLVDRLVNLEQLAVLPVAGEKGAQWSSYDRASRYDEATGKYVAWDANGDGDGFIRQEGDKFVMAEMDGPGCIWRIWSAAPKEGKVAIYLDGANEAVVDLPFIGYFNGKNEPFTRSALVHTVSRGWNNYTPIPYQKSCKIVAEKGWGQYFQFVYQTFPKGTSVPTFSRNLGVKEEQALNRANEILTRPDYTATRPYAGQEWLTERVVVAPGQKVALPVLKGPQAITALRARLANPPGSVNRDTLRELAIQIRWDGENEPSVWAPFGDFFGTTGSNNYRSLPLGHDGDDWWYSYWYMPFGKEARIEIANDGKTSREVLFEVGHAPLTKDLATLGRFHAKWHRDAFLPAEPERAIDWTLLKTTGAGRFVGVMLHVWNPRGSWWGEGDEKFFVDGEKFPSTIGTGSEDYFGYAWCDPGLFGNAFHNQTQNDGNNRGHITVNRWHIADNVPFHTGFEGAIEKYYPNSRPTLYASTVYWYLAPGGKDPYKPSPVAERVGYAVPVQTAGVKGALEGERLKIVSKTGGNPQEQDLGGFSGHWSGDAHLWWTEAKPGDKLVLEVPVAKAGIYHVKMQFTKAIDYGTAQLTLDGRKLGEAMDFFNPSVIPTGEMDLGIQELAAGPHHLQVEITGANEKAVKSYMFGLDYVKLDPAK
jgi:hypothetical protein